MATYSEWGGPPWIVLQEGVSLARDTLERSTAADDWLSESNFKLNTRRLFAGSGQRMI